MQMSYCTKCDTSKNSLEFYPSQRKDRGICKICWRDCPSQSKEGVKKYKDKNIDKVKLWKQRDYNKNRKQYLWSGARKRAIDNGLEFNITVDDIVFPNICPILSIPIIIDCGHGNNWNSPSIDRIDNTKGYTKDNIVIISHKANNLKNDASNEELIKIYEFYHKLLGEENVEIVPKV